MNAERLLPVLLLAVSGLSMPVRGQTLVDTDEPEAAVEAAPEPVPDGEPGLDDLRDHVAALQEALLRSDAKTQREAAAAIEQTVKDIKAVADPTGLRAAMRGFAEALELVLEASPPRGSEANRRILESLKKLDGRLTALVPPAELPGELKPAERAAAQALGAVRSALSIYYGDTEGRYPADPAQLAPKYLPKIPALELSDHKPTDAVRILASVKDQQDLESQLKDTGGWLYVSDPRSPLHGTISIDCTHKDSRGRVWSEY